MSPGPEIRAGAHAPLPLRDYAGTCRWCGGPADSREHRHKASDLRREFAKAEYEANEVILSRAHGRPNVDLRGPNAKVAKFGHNFCSRCNNDRSQPFDRAYDRFIEWYLENEAEVERTGRVPLDQIFDDWESGSVHVNCYYAKHAACRIADQGFQVPLSIIGFLNGNSEPVGIAFNFEINGALGGVNALLKRNPSQWGTSGNLGLGPVTGEMTRAERHAVLLRSWISYHALQVFWEWSTDYPRSWTNLLGPVAEFPLVDSSERTLLDRVARPGVQGHAWRGWYGARRKLGLAAKLSAETQD